MKIIAKGIDVSVFQGNINWKKVVSSGVKFAFIRGGYGRSGIDEKFEVNYKNAVKAGLPVGVYHYSYATSVERAREEADFCLSYLKGKKFEYPVAFDIEDKSLLGLSKSELTEITKTFCQTVEKAGYYVCIYSSKAFLLNKLDMERLSRFDVWVAQWNDKCTYTGNYGLWQYSDKGGVNGIKGNVDLDYAYKDYPTYIKKNGLNGFAKSTSSANTKPKTNNSTTTTKPATSTNIKVGSVVKITGNRYYNGTTIPSWVKSRQWIVYSVSGDKVIINQDKDKKYAIMSPIKITGVALANNSSTTTTKPTTNTSKSNIIEVGDVVKITGKYYYNSNSKIPLWVRLKQWVVYSISGNRIVIDKDVGGKNRIMSPISRNDLKLVRKGK